MFDNKKPSWFYGLAIGMTTEVLHMLLVFLTNMSDIYAAFQVVEKCAAPMILCNGVSVMLSLLLVAMIGKERVIRREGAYQLSQMFQFLLLICVIAAFAVTCIFTDALQTRIAYANADQLLALNLDDVEKDVRDVSDDNLLRIAQTVAGKVTADSTRDELNALRRATAWWASTSWTRTVSSPRARWRTSWALIWSPAPSRRSFCACWMGRALMSRATSPCPPTVASPGNTPVWPCRRAASSRWATMQTSSRVPSPIRSVWR